MDHRYVEMNPLTSGEPSEQNSLPFDEEIERSFDPSKTAMARSRPSSIAQLLVRNKIVDPSTPSRILDYGCGRGSDVKFYRSLGFQCDGFDPHEAFGWTDLPTGEYDVVTVVFVLNVVENPELRTEVLEKAMSYLRTGGSIYVATRSSKAIEEQARRQRWKRYGDGYISHASKGTFQKGIDSEELVDTLTRLGAHIERIAGKISPDVTLVGAKKTRPS